MREKYEEFWLATKGKKGASIKQKKNHYNDEHGTHDQ